MRRAPAVAWRDFWAPIFNAGQFLTFLAAIIGLVIILQGATDAERDQQAQTWAVSVEAFLIAAGVWALVSLLRSPFVVWSEERGRGEWHGSRFIYREPQLLATIRAKATGQVERYLVRLQDAEPASFVYYEIRLESSAHQIVGGTFGALVMMSSLEPGAIQLRGGTRIEQSQTSYLYLKLPQEAVSQTVSVYMRDFAVGEVVDKDGVTGDGGWQAPNCSA